MSCVQATIQKLADEKRRLAALLNEKAGSVNIADDWTKLTAARQAIDDLEKAGLSVAGMLADPAKVAAVLKLASGATDPKEIESALRFRRDLEEKLIAKNVPERSPDGLAILAAAGLKQSASEKGKTGHDWPPINADIKEVVSCGLAVTIEALDTGTAARPIPDQLLGREPLQNVRAGLADRPVPYPDKLVPNLDQKGFSVRFLDGWQIVDSDLDGVSKIVADHEVEGDE